MIWSGSGCRYLPPPALPMLFCLLSPSLFDGLMLGLNPFDGGVLEFELVLAGDESGFDSSVVNAALRFWISCHSSTIKASLASSDSCFRSGSFFIPLSNVYLVFLSRGLSNYDYNLIELVWHSAKEYIAHRLFESVEQLEELLHKLLNEGELVIQWGRKIKNKGNAVCPV